MDYSDVTSHPNTVDALHDLLHDLPTEILQLAVKSCCAEPGRAFPPSGGEIRGMAFGLLFRASGTPSAGEAWGAILRIF